MSRAGAAITLFFALGTSGVSACGNPSTCASGVDTQCTPLYAPSFDNIFQNTLQPTCAQNGASCHTAAGHMGGLTYEDPDQAYDLLLGQVDGRARVLPGNPACSILIERLFASDPLRAMPPGAPLSAPERCAFVQWIAQGAKR